MIENFLNTLEYIPKLWGGEFLVTNTDLYCAKILRVEPNYLCSLHYHKNKTETFKILYGTVYLELPSGLRIMYTGDEALIRPYTPHRFSTLRGAAILEISTHHDDEDSYRIEPSRKIEASNESRPEENIQAS